MNLQKQRSYPHMNNYHMSRNNLKTKPAFGAYDAEREFEAQLDVIS
jgi:hypothetical protein